MKAGQTPLQWQRGAGHAHSSLATGRWSLATLPAPLRSSPHGAKITTLLDLETLGRPTVSNT